LIRFSLPQWNARARAKGSGEKEEKKGRKEEEKKRKDGREKKKNKTTVAVGSSKDSRREIHKTGER